MLSKKIYDKFISDGDFVGAANYLSRAHFSDPVKQQMVNQTIKSLRTDGRKIQGMMSHADSNQRKAFSFLNAVNSNGILPGLNNDTDANGNKIRHSSPSFFCCMNHYDNNGHKVGESRPGFFGSMKHYDNKGNKQGHSEPGLFGGYNHYDE